MKRASRALAAAGIVSALLILAGCAAWDSLRERLRVLDVRFSFATLDVAGLAYPQDAREAASDLLNFGTAARRKYGVDVRCRLRAENTNRYAAAFDGAEISLRVGDTGPSAPAARAHLPSFRVGGQGETHLDVVFPLRLDNPVFGKSTWIQILRGESISYRLNAELPYRVLNDSVPEALRALGQGKVRLDVAKGSVDARAAAGTALNLLLKALDKVW